MTKHVKNKIGLDGFGTFLAILADSLDNLARNGTSNIRTIEIKYNDYFSTKFDFDKGGYIDE
ncbi:MAG: hypothetical protein K5765_06590 [Clostridia bacterium]|nr:hypothetical protein [Clostridia bacterium]